MSPALAWILGRGGFLGSRTARALPVEMADVVLWPPQPLHLPWTDPSLLAEALLSNVRQFADEARRARGPWMIAWCAGRGVVGTTAPELETEARIFEMLLDLVARHLADAAPELPGVFLLSSSAGGVWGGSPEQLLTEATPCLPISDYGRCKIRQEKALLGWATSRPHVRFLIARLSNLYGPGQSLDKPQGLISHLTRSLIRHQPVHIYSPLDTLRDYFYVDDCARHLARCLARLRTEPPGTGVTKIFAAGHSHSIASLVAILSRIAKRHPRIITSSHASSRQQPRSLLFRSILWTDVPPPTLLDLAVGIHAVYQDHLALFRTGKLAGARKI